MTKNMDEPVSIEEQEAMKEQILAARVKLRDIIGESDLLKDDAPFGEIKAPEGYDGINALPFVDLTILKTSTTPEQVDELCAIALAEKTATICVNPIFIKQVGERLEGSEIIPIATVNFPLGAGTAESVAAETAAAIAAGAKEVDTVTAVGFLKSGKYQEVLDIFKATVEAAGDIPLKVILETCELTDEEIIEGSLLAQIAGAKFVKTSTGFGTANESIGKTSNGATVHDVTLMKLTVGGNGTLVKASGKVGDGYKAKLVLEGGADRIGASATNLKIEEGGEEKVAVNDY